jgi:hypothetical protein
MGMIAMVPTLLLKEHLSMFIFGQTKGYMLCLCTKKKITPLKNC